jgi:hypothetical protein
MFFYCLQDNSDLIYYETKQLYQLDLWLYYLLNLLHGWFMHTLLHSLDFSVKCSVI